MSIYRLTFTENNKTFEIDYQGNIFTAAPGGIGFSYDSKKIAETAYNECRTGNTFARFFKMMSIKNKGKEIEPIFIEDREYFDEAIEMLLSEFTLASKPVSVQVDESQNVATVTINKEEKLPDYDKLFETVKAMVEN